MALLLLVSTLPPPTHTEAFQHGTGVPRRVGSSCCNGSKTRHALPPFGTTTARRRRRRRSSSILMGTDSSSSRRRDGWLRSGTFLRGRSPFTASAAATAAAAAGVELLHVPGESPEGDGDAGGGAGGAEPGGEGKGVAVAGTAQGIEGNEAAPPSPPSPGRSYAKFSYDPTESRTVDSQPWPGWGAGRAAAAVVATEEMEPREEEVELPPSPTTPRYAKFSYRHTESGFAVVQARSGGEAAGEVGVEEGRADSEGPQLQSEGARPERPTVHGGASSAEGGGIGIASVGAAAGAGTEADDDHSGTGAPLPAQRPRVEGGDDESEREEGDSDATTDPLVVQRPPIKPKPKHSEEEPLRDPNTWGEADYTEGSLPALPGSYGRANNPTARYLEELDLEGVGPSDGTEGPVLKAAQRYQSSDWWQVLTSLPKSRVFRRIRSHLLAAALWSCLVVGTWWHFPFTVERIRMPNFALDMLGGVISTLLAFRMNQSYRLFWESRRLWAEAVGNSRSVAQLVSNASPTAMDMGSKESVLRLLTAYHIGLKQHLRGKRDFDEYRGVLSGEEVSELRRCRLVPMPMALCNQIEGRLRQTNLSEEFLGFVVQVPMQELVKLIGKMERIVRSPAPLGYTRFTSRVLSMFFLAFPFRLLGDVHVFLLPLAVSMCAWAMFSIEEIGHLVEEPFGATPLDDEPEVGSGVWPFISEERPKPLLPLTQYCTSVQAEYAAVMAGLEKGGGS